VQKKAYQTLNLPIICGGVHIIFSDIVVADEEGIVVIPHNEKRASIKISTRKSRYRKNQSLEERGWLPINRKLSGFMSSKFYLV
jgi:regulator of RNase E activity RraA